MLLSPGGKPSGGESQSHSYKAAEPGLRPRCCPFRSCASGRHRTQHLPWVSNLCCCVWTLVLEQGLAKGLAKWPVVVVTVVATSTAAGFLPLMSMLQFYGSVKQSTHRKFTTATGEGKQGKQRCSDLFSDVMQLLVWGNWSSGNVPNNGKANQQH